MSKLLIATAVFGLMAGAALAGDIVIPTDKTPFKVKDGDTVRIPAAGIAGTEIKATVKGPAKETISRVTTRVKGAMPIGPGNHEVDLKTNGKGKVTVEITITPPNGKPTTEKYEFEVE